MTLPASVALGTMHGKAAAIAPPLDRLGVRVEVPVHLDTDQFGTFTGETPRAGSMVEAARAKARSASGLTGLPVGLGSEGAYGPNPAFPWAAQGREVLVWHDTRTGHEIVETLIDDTPTWEQVDVHGMPETKAFLERIGFPATAVVVATSDGFGRPLAKGVQDRDVLDRLIRTASGQGPIVLQTDMRAHLNPRRMTVIGRLAQKLARRLQQTCINCGAPGWGTLRRAEGLPCKWCGGPTLLDYGEIQGCTACGAEQLVARADGVTLADPAHCPNCNP